MRSRRGRLSAVFFDAVSATYPILPRPTDNPDPRSTPRGPRRCVTGSGESCRGRNRGTSPVVRVRESVMARKPPSGDPVQDAPQVADPQHSAAGLPAVAHSLRVAQQQMGVRRAARTLLKVNQKDGFDCPGCAWPEGDHRHTAEFCENGVKAVAEEATLRRVTPDFFAAHPVADLARRSGYWLGQQGRITQPMLLERGADDSPHGDNGGGGAGSGEGGGDRYEPVSWERAFAIIAEELNALDSPTRRCSTPRAARATRLPSCSSCSPASSVRTICRTAPTCATSRPVRRSPRPWASARAACPWRTCTRRT